MSEPQAQGQAARPRGKGTSDRWVKRGFLLVLLAATGIIVCFQLRGPLLAGMSSPDGKVTWGSDLAAAQAQAGKEDRRVVVFVRKFPAADMAKQMVKTTLIQPANWNALRDGKFIAVEVKLEPGADWARRYEVTTSPTMLVISPDGKEFHKQEGFIGETAFRDTFLKAPLGPVQP